MDLKIRNRSRLRRKEIEDLAARLAQEFGTKEMFKEDDPVEYGEYEGGKVIVLGHEIVGILREDKPGPSVRGLLKWGATKRFVTVDMGAVRFVTNGADIMGPGIVDADPEIKAGDIVWIREERHQKPLAVGQALSDGSVLKAKTKGKQVKSLHFVGDRIWIWGQEETQPAAPAPTEPGAEQE